MQKLLGQMRCAADRYHMIEEGDRIAIGVSGGKDSVALLAGMSALRRFYPARFDLVAVTLDPCFSGVETDYSPIEQLCGELEIPYRLRRTELAKSSLKRAKKKIRAACAPGCGAACCMMKRRPLDATKLPSATTWTTRRKR